MNRDIKFRVWDKTEKIDVCDCGSPLVWTLVFDYKEWLCLECGCAYEMMMTNSVVETPELKHKKKLYEKIWHTLVGFGGFLPIGRYHDSTCKKCVGDNHHEHLSEKEIMKDEIAKDVFRRLISYDELCKIITNGTSEGWTILPAKEEPTINKWVAPVMPAPYNPCPSTTPNLPNGWPNKVTC